MAIEKRQREPKRKPARDRLKATWKKHRERLRENVFTMRIIWHDAGGPLTGTRADLSNIRDELPKNSSAIKPIVDTMDNIGRLLDYTVKISDLLHSRQPYFWKRAGAAIRARRAIAWDRAVIKKLKELKELPDIKANRNFRGWVEKGETNLESHIRRYSAFFSRELKNPMHGYKEPVDVNRFIRVFLDAEAPIVDKQGRKVPVEFVPGDIPIKEFNPDDLAQILENLLTDTLGHQENPRVRISTERLGDHFAIDFLNLGGMRIPEDILPKIGKEVYSITGSPSKGVGKMSVNRTADRYGGWLDIRNTDDGPLLRVLVPA